MRLEVPQRSMGRIRPLDREDRFAASPDAHDSSDHGSVDSIPYRLEEMLPGRPRMTASGGLGHIYLAESGNRLSYSEVRSARPDLLSWLQAQKEIAVVMAREGSEDVLLFN